MPCSLFNTVGSSLAVIIGCWIFWMNPTPWLAVVCAIGIILITRSLDERSRANTKLVYTDRPVLITGCDTGFGHALAKTLAAQGVTVFAGCLRSSGNGGKNLENFNKDNLYVIQMDVTNADEVEQAVEYIKKKTRSKGLWGLVNNAGLNFLGDIELTTMEQFERITNINQLGMVCVTKAFLPQIRQNRGRIVNVTSVKGRLSNIFNAAYGMTKFAGETFSDILRQEMIRFGVHVSIIEPGNFGGATGCLEMTRIRNDFTTMWDNMSADLRTTYGRDYVMAHPNAAESAIPTACTDLCLVTDAMIDALFTVQPKARYLIGGSNSWYDSYKWKVYLALFLPEWLMDSLEERACRGFPLPKALEKTLKND